MLDANQVLFTTGYDLKAEGPISDHEAISMLDSKEIIHVFCATLDEESLDNITEEMAFRFINYLDEDNDGHLTDEDHKLPRWVKATTTWENYRLEERNEPYTEHVSYRQ